MNKAASRVNWENYTSTNTPLNANNLNKMDLAIDVIDDRVIELNTTKADVTVVDGLIKSWSINNETGIITVTFQNGATQTFHTNLAKVSVNFVYDKATQQLVITYADGTKDYIDISEFITEFEFATTDNIGFNVVEGVVSANILDHSVTEEKLQRNFLANCIAAEENAKASEISAESHNLQAEAWAVGQRNGTDVPNSDITYENNAKFYAQQAKDANDSINKYLNMAEFDVDGDGNLIVTNADTVPYKFTVDNDGNLNWEVV